MMTLRPTFHRTALSLALAATLALGPWSGFLSAFSDVPTGSSVAPKLIEVEQGIHHYQLPSGQHVYVKSMPDQPIVTLDTWVETGSVNETPATNGVSHFLEHLLFKGSNRVKLGELDRQLEAMGGVFNAATSLDYTHYYIQIPSSAFEKALDLHANMLMNATLPGDAIDRERSVVQEEINRSLDNPQNRMIRTLTATIFAGHGYAYDTLGPKSLIQTVPRDAIVDYYRTWYQPKHFHTIVVGQVEPEAAVRQVQQAFEAEWAVQREPQPDAGYTAPTQPALAKGNAPIVKVITDPNVTQAYLVMGFLGPKAAEHEDTFALDTALMAVGDGHSSRLWQALKETTHTVQTIGAGNWTQKDAGMAYVTMELPAENVEKASRQLWQVLRTAATEGLTKAELEKAKTSTRRSFVFLNESTEGIASNIGYNVTIGSLKDFTGYADGVQAVTLEDATRALRQYLNPRHAVLVAVVPSAKGLEKSSKATKKAAKADKKPTADLAAPKLQQALAQQLATQPWPTSPTAVAAANTTDAGPAIAYKTLANGMRLIVKTRPQTETVALQVMVSGGRGTETKPGTASVLARLFSKGTPLRNQATLAQTLESQAMSLGTSAGEDFIQMTGTALKEDLAEFLWILSDVLTHAKLAETDLAQVKTEIARDIAASEEQPATLAMQALQQALYPAHPYGGVGQRMLQSLPTLTRDDILAYYHRHFVPKNMVVSVSGNVNAEELGRVLEAAFPATINDMATAFGDNGNATPLQATAVSPLTHTETIRTQKSEQAATSIAQGWLAPAIATSKDYAALKLINTLLGTGLSSRLFVELREKQGLGYVAATVYPSTQQASRFLLYMGTDPRNEAKVLAGFDAQIKRLMDEPLTDDELRDAKQKLKGQFALAHESNTDHAYYLGVYEALGVGYDFDAAYPALIDSLTAADVQAAAQKIFSAPHITSIVAPKTVRGKLGEDDQP